MNIKKHILGFMALVLAAVASAQNAVSASNVAGRKTGDVMSITLPGGAEMEMIWCAPGSVDMGSPVTEAGRLDDETRRTVSISAG